MTIDVATTDKSGSALAEREIALVDLLDRLLAGGVVLTGDVTLSIADIDLVHISLRALITSVKAGHPSPWADGALIKGGGDHG